MFKKIGGIILLSIFLTISFAQTSEGLGQLAGKLTFELKPGESETLQWGMVNEKVQGVTVFLSAKGVGFELLSYPETVFLPAESTTYVDVTVTIPSDYQNDVYFKPFLTAIEPNESEDIVRISMAIQPILEIVIGDPLVREVTAQPAPEVIEEEEIEEEVMEESGPGSFTINPSKEDETSTQEENQEEGGGCLISTATFGSELSPQVQMLREIRDNNLLSTESGSTFMTGFNTLYYSFSPTIADLERQSPIFREVVQVAITPLITSLSLLNYVDMDSEAEVLGYGISLIMLNVAMYFIAPAILISRLRR